MWNRQNEVAPRAGAWIETNLLYHGSTGQQSHPVRVRGLKQKIMLRPQWKSLSHPVRVRGLKQTKPYPFE